MSNRPGTAHESRAASDNSRSRGHAGGAAAYCAASRRPAGSAPSWSVPRRPSTVAVCAAAQYAPSVEACGGVVAGARQFLPGHDQRAIHDRTSAQWGSTMGFIRRFDDTYRQSAEQPQG